MKALKDFIFGRNYCLVEDTFNLRWTRRFYFDFAPSPNAAAIQALPRNEQGGVIVLPLDVNAADGHRIMSIAKTWVGSLGKNANRDLQGVVKEASISSGLGLSNHFRGRYRSRAGSVYNEQSLALEVLFVTKQELVMLATMLTQELGVESVLAMSNATKDVHFVAHR